MPIVCPACGTTLQLQIAAVMSAPGMEPLRTTAAAETATAAETAAAETAPPAPRSPAVPKTTLGSRSPAGPQKMLRSTIPTTPKELPPNSVGIKEEAKEEEEEAKEEEQTENPFKKARTTTLTMKAEPSAFATAPKVPTASSPFAAVPVPHAPDTSAAPKRRSAAVERPPSPAPLPSETSWPVPPPPPPPPPASARPPAPAFVVLQPGHHVAHGVVMPANVRAIPPETPPQRAEVAHRRVAEAADAAWRQAVAEQEAEAAAAAEAAEEGEAAEAARAHGAGDVPAEAEAAEAAEAQDGQVTKQVWNKLMKIVWAKVAQKDC